MYFAGGRFRDASTEWRAFAPSDELNAPASYFSAGTAALLAGDQDLARTAADALSKTRGSRRMRELDGRLLEAGLAALDGRHSDAIREARAAIDDYERLRLPWRAALGGLMLATILGPDDHEVRERASVARETFVRLGAKPFVAFVDEALARRPATADGAPAAGRHAAVRDVSVEAR